MSYRDLGQVLRRAGRTAMIISASLWTEPGTCQALAVETQPSISTLTQEEIREAMTEERQLGYDATATTNVARFFAGSVLRLIRRADSVSSSPKVLAIHHDDWYGAFLNVHGLTDENAPQYLKLAHEHNQDVLIDYDPAHGVKEVREGRVPLRVLNVVLSWPESDRLPDKYSFEDTLSEPKLKVTNHRVLRYRLLDYGDMISYDEIEGLTGRPASGLLGALFKIIGEGRVVWSRMATTQNGIEVVRAKSKKAFISVTTTVSIYPDGTAMKGLPDETPEFIDVENRLKEDIEIDYQDWALPETLEEYVGTGRNHEPRP